MVSTDCQRCAMQKNHIHKCQGKKSATRDIKRKIENHAIISMIHSAVCVELGLGYDLHSIWSDSPMMTKKRAVEVGKLNKDTRDVRGDNVRGVGLVEIATTFRRTTQTRNLVLLDRKVVVWDDESQSTIARSRARHTIRNLVPEFDILLGINDNLLLPTDRDNLGRTIGITRVIDQSPILIHRASDTFRRLNRPNGKITHPRLPFFVASTTRSSSIRKR